MPTFQNDPVQSKTDSTSPSVFAENTNATPQAGVGVHAKSAAAGVLAFSALAILEVLALSAQVRLGLGSSAKPSALKMAQLEFGLTGIKAALG